MSSSALNRVLEGAWTQEPQEEGHSTQLLPEMREKLSNECVCPQLEDLLTMSPPGVCWVDLLSPRRVFAGSTVKNLFAKLCSNRAQYGIITLFLELLYIHDIFAGDPGGIKSAQKAFSILRKIRRTISRITRMDFQILYEAYVRPLLEYANQVFYSGRAKDVTLIERFQRAATRMVAGIKSVDYKMRLANLNLLPLKYRCLRGDLILVYALFKHILANRFFTVDQAYTRRWYSRKIFKLRAHTSNKTFLSFRVLREMTFFRRLSTLLLEPGLKHY
ncbi:LOW QUALITY PROTEIN: hypothetical protein T265_13974 [Opisthorchis viverrini]|uniref:Uncharacterized protein n=1 Tax=Opisthorchis viverrini TaxID=6198 RepID=A0A074ZL41_OPIVI|nr:LOW QUALITY PROTEIN: hypothetical protein T265_13974 [Opisthorchis viverrini]KER26507.1 LOW QUALITY PROTEIN: hypothetical protein T265_13974 [Opisthorchis viverrini]